MVIEIQHFEIVEKSGLWALVTGGFDFRMDLEVRIAGLPSLREWFEVSPSDGQSPLPGQAERAIGKSIRSSFEPLARRLCRHWSRDRPEAPRCNVDPRDPFDPTPFGMAWRALGHGFGGALGIGWFLAQDTDSYRIHPAHYAMPIFYTMGVVRGAHVGNQERGNHGASLLAAAAVYVASAVYMQQERDRLPAYYAATVVGSFTAAMIVEAITTEHVPLVGSDGTVGMTWHDGPALALRGRF